MSDNAELAAEIPAEPVELATEEATEAAAEEAVELTAEEPVEPAASVEERVPELVD